MCGKAFTERHTGERERKRERETEDFGGVYFLILTLSGTRTAIYSSLRKQIKVLFLFLLGTPSYRAPKSLGISFFIKKSLEVFGLTKKKILKNLPNIYIYILSLPL